MATITDDQLYQYADRVKGKVVLITGAANGIGKQAALSFASHGAKVVIGDLDLPGAEKVVAEINQAGGQSACLRCDVTKWDDQVDLFEFAETTYGSVDVVVPNAGVTEIGKFHVVPLANGRPSQPPITKTLEINLIAVTYTAYLGMFYLKKNKADGDLKSLILLGSMASWQAIPGGPMYSASKHGVLGFMRSLYHPCLEDGIRIGIIHPFFADTAIVPIYVKLALAGIPLTSTARIAGAVFYAATDPDMESSGCPWLLPDDGYVFRLPREQLKEGVYRMIDERAKAAIGGVQNVKMVTAVVRDVWRLVGRKIFFAALGALATQRGYKLYLQNNA
jgi:NAD(P)-dependent dehydrogenase (short-subunit alcohol dehydrogenase family)